MAVKNCSYPPTIKFVVMYNKELRRTGQCTWVELHISGMDPEMEFQCRAYEQAQGSSSLTNAFSYCICFIFCGVKLSQFSQISSYPQSFIPQKLTQDVS